MRADLVGRNHECLVLDRPRADQDLPVRRTGDLRERRGQRDHTCASDGEDPEQLGEAQVVADAKPEW
jgi:hypothetical protein